MIISPNTCGQVVGSYLDKKRSWIKRMNIHSSQAVSDSDSGKNTNIEAIEKKDIARSAGGFYTLCTAPISTAYLLFQTEKKKDARAWRGTGHDDPSHILQEVSE